MTRSSDLVGEGLEAKPGAVVGGGLLGIAHPPLDVIKLEESPSLRLGTLVSVGRPYGSLARIMGCHLSPLTSEERLWGLVGTSCQALHLDLMSAGWTTLVLNLSQSKYPLSRLRKRCR